LISEYCGIYFDDGSQFILERRLNRRLKLNGLDNFRDYFRFLLYNRRKDEEMSEIVDVLTVNETYFFREQNQLNSFINEVCQDLKALNSERKSIRIWSAGCASGEEPYTLAMLILERKDEFEGWNIEIVGSDINQRVLHTARKGVYRKNSFRTTDQYYMSKYFEQEDGNWVGLMDVVFCRNVLIYFRTDARKKVIDSFFRRLNDGGYLLLGHAESLMNISTAFALKHLREDLVYQKPKKPVVSMSDESLFKMIWGR
jgi:chemotaxis protein methyltransferase CheR